MPMFDFEERKNKHQRAAEEWIEKNPDAFRLFEKFALEMVERRRKFGIAQLAERVRWEVIATWENDSQGYKINNNHKAYIARELIRRYPSMAEFLETRKISDPDPNEGLTGH